MSLDNLSLNWGICLSLHWCLEVLCLDVRVLSLFLDSVPQESLKEVNIWSVDLVDGKHGLDCVDKLVREPKYLHVGQIGPNGIWELGVS